MHEKEKLTLDKLIEEAKRFCTEESQKEHAELFNVNDGKTIGTFIENRFKSCLKEKYIFSEGNIAKGVDFPDPSINTDLKVTSLTRPQSSCPYTNARQKIYGLGFNILIFVYEKIDYNETTKLNFVNASFIEKSRTADYTTTKHINEMLDKGCPKNDIISFLEEKEVSSDLETLNRLAEEILINRPPQGYLTISNAMQWRLKYSWVINAPQVEGITRIEIEH